MKPQSFRRLFNFWPPILFAGIRIEEVADDWRFARVKLKLRWYNRNYVGTAFGGSLFAMTDPFWMILTMESLGSDYVVWDKAGEIEFVSPGKEDVWAEFRLEQSAIDEIREAAAGGQRVLRWFETEVKTASNQTVARVRKQLYVRLKKVAQPNSSTDQPSSKPLSDA
jgi:acyl-coenzyme A thioesterase PaaI-like protein